MRAQQFCASSRVKDRHKVETPQLQQRLVAPCDRLRAQGPGPVPNLQDPDAELRREIELLPKPPENDAIDNWIEAAYDWESWK
jgi:hypothetical protein